ncbi:hypothetical protein EV44_g0674 [Erysiphe necator]|uniref:Uncharacterized protein n=1 Tax=Uncinula necator TaxID=52586 RepID=A0A0B1PAN3_UNCNE|nr:hypothetical protein EV44_g0674 [Erysiphe necator]
MSNYKLSIYEHSLFPVNSSKLSSECPTKENNHGSRKLSNLNRNTTDLSILSKTSNDLRIKFSSEFNNSFISMNQRRTLPNKNVRLIPLKLGSTVKTSEKVSSICDDSAPSSSLATQLQSPPMSMPDDNGKPLLEKEFRSTMAGVKLLYLQGNFKRCAMRCRMLLERNKDSFHIDPSYRIYLASYLASSLEITAFVLPNYSSAKLPLYHEALSRLQSAALELDYALFCTDSILHNSTISETSSMSSSARSSVDSVFSRCSRASSIASLSSLPEEYNSASPAKESDASENRQKKVSFSLPPYGEQELSRDFEAIQSISTSSLLDSFPISTASCVSMKRKSLQPAPLNISVARSSSPLLKLKSYNLSNSAHLKFYQNLLLGFQAEFEHRIKELKRIIDEITRYSTDIQYSCESKSELIKLRRRRTEEGWPRKRFDGSRYQALCEMALNEL